MEVGVFLIALGIQTWVGWLIGKSKGRPVLGFWLGLLLGLLGWLIIAIMPKTLNKEIEDLKKIDAAAW